MARSFSMSVNRDTMTEESRMDKSKIMWRLSVILPVIVLFTLIGCNGSSSNNRQSGIVHGAFQGIDVSHHQGDIDWAAVKRSAPELAFVYVKCSEGKSYVDPKFRVNADGAYAQGFKVGAYHYFRMTSSAHDQFRNFKRQMDKIVTDLIPMVDVERSDGKSRKELQDSLRVFLNLLEKQYGSRPMLYGTNRSYNELCAPEFNDYPLYIGRYGNNEPSIKGPSHYTIWQYSENGSIEGIPKPVDLCRFHSDCSGVDITRR